MDMKLSGQGIPVVHTNESESMATVVGSTACSTGTVLQYDFSDQADSIEDDE